MLLKEQYKVEVRLTTLQDRLSTNRVGRSRRIARELRC
jgi:hypothetical protein